MSTNRENVIQFSKTLKIYDIDIAGYSGCGAIECQKKLECKRGLLYLYLIENKINGHTILLLNGEQDCKHFIPY